MAAKILDDASAIQACRKSKPTATTAKAILQWAAASPRPDKIAWLLLLQTGNYLSRKSLDAGFTETLCACAAGDAGPLWRTVERDWETYRVWHAIRAIAHLRDKRETEKLLRLGAEPYLRIHWSAIKTAASEQGIAIPADIAEAQGRLEIQRGKADFHPWFEARKAAWPQTEDLDIQSPDRAAAKGMPASSAKATADKTAPAAKAGGFPDFLAPEQEENAFIKDRKQGLAKAWSLKSMNPLFDTVDLAYYLVALGRGRDAETICRLLADSVTFSGNFNIWSPVGSGIVLKARLLRAAGKAAEADAALQPVLANPFNRTPPPDQLAEQLQALPGDLEKATAHSGKKAACQSIARKLYTTTYFLEHAAARVPGYTGYPTEALEALWSRGLSLLADRIGS